MQITVDNQFPAQGFLYVCAMKRHGFACERGFCGHADISRDGCRSGSGVSGRGVLPLIRLKDNGKEIDNRQQDTDIKYYICFFHDFFLFSALKDRDNLGFMRIFAG